MGRLRAGILGLVCAIFAQGTPITVVNPSFEADTPSQSTCGTDCAFHAGLHSGWTTSDPSNTATWRPGLAALTFFFNVLPAGPQILYANGGAFLSQMVVESAVAGVSYTLEVDLGFRKDLTPFVEKLGFAELRIGNNIVLATGSAPSPGNWSTYTALYTAVAGDEGQGISIVLGSGSNTFASFDNVRLNSSTPNANSVPEPAGMAVLGLASLLAAQRYWRR